MQTAGATDETLSVAVLHGSGRLAEFHTGSPPLVQQFLKVLRAAAQVVQHKLIASATAAWLRKRMSHLRTDLLPIVTGMFLSLIQVSIAFGGSMWLAI